MPRLFKCPICEQHGLKEDMQQVKTGTLHGKDKFRYYHQEYCYDKYLKDREATKIENEQWDSLYQYIVDLHGLVVLSKGNITRLKELRAGYITKDGKRERQWRSGPSFALMLDAYKLAEDSIRWCISNTLKGSNDVKAINYCISIMINKLNEAHARRQHRKRQEIINSRSREEDQSIKIVATNTVDKTKNSNKDEMDITDFL